MPYKELILPIKQHLVFFYNYLFLFTESLQSIQASRPSFVHSSLQPIPHVLVRFRPGNWDDHARSMILWSFLCWFGHFLWIIIHYSFWKVNWQSIFSFSAEQPDFFPGIKISWTRWCHVFRPLEENQPHNITDTPPYFIINFFSPL